MSIESEIQVGLIHQQRIDIIPLDTCIHLFIIDPVGSKIQVKHRQDISTENRQYELHITYKNAELIIQVFNVIHCNNRVRYWGKVATIKF